MNGLSVDLSIKRELLAVFKTAASSPTKGKSAACAQLASVAETVKDAGTKLTPPQAAQIMSDVTRIKAVLGCS